MCAVSMITDHYKDKWPVNSYLEMISITRYQWEEYQKLKKAAEDYDRRTKQPDCVKPDVAEWEQRIEEFLKKKGIL